MLEFNNFTECYLGLLEKVYTSPEYISKPRGMKVKESLGCTFKIKNPRDRIPYVPHRNFSMEYMIAELLWYISADNSTEWISNYSSFWRKISDDGSTANSAYGARIFKPHDRIAGGELTQWDFIKKELEEDSDSRRAVIHIRSPWDSLKAKLDVPCTLTLQFFIRENKLHMITNMRSSDLILGIAYDIPAFTFFQEMLALELGVELGEYIHTSNSLHIYERHFEMVEKILLQDSRAQSDLFCISRGAMEGLPSLPPTKQLYLLEKEIRNCKSPITISECLDEFISFGVCGEPYWIDWGKILCAHRLGKLGYKSEKKRMINSTNFVGYHTLEDR